ncbi:PilT/PilU family type 4a pilus ATPase [Candidatus Uhrbacteria bacterium]|nr:PilT/PilU family type 4a pilus ATPase [Candidatus Uhrbacteria bacterium]
MPLQSIDPLLREAVGRRASDMHLVVGHPPLFRIDGALVAVSGKRDLALRELEGVLRLMLSELQWKTFQTSHELDFAYEAGDHRFRMNLHMERGNPALAGRLIRRELPTFEEIGLPASACAMITHPSGLVLVTGPAGSGKSTTLAAMIGQINATRPVHIVTLEDPVEFVFPSAKGLVKQREVGTDTQSFAEGLKHLLRQDPEVIMVGEMRDPETIATVLTLAETGHLVFSTLHTRSAAATVTRIIDAFPATQQDQIRLQLSLSLRGIVSQVLFPKKGGGRVAAREILVANAAVGNLIREQKIEQIPNVLLTGRKEGMCSFSQSVQELVAEDILDETFALPYLDIRRKRV